MSVLEKLEIIFTGDSTQLESSIKTIVGLTTRGVQSINDQSVDWTSILSKSISPAIITGIASMFANAIVQYTRFQAAAMNLNDAGTQSTADFANSINSLGGTAYTLAQSAGASLGDTAAAFETFSKAGLDSGAAMQAVIASNNIALETGQSMGDVVKELTSLFSNWGVTTLPQVNAALDGLTNAVGQGQFGFQDLVSTISDSGPLLKTSTNISQIAMDLQHMTNEAGQSQSSVQQMFSTFLDGFANTTSNLNIFLGGMTSIKNALGDGGLIPIFEKITDKVGTFGANTGLAAQILGISATTAQIFGQVTDVAYQKAQKASEDALKSMSPWQQVLKDHESDVTKMAKAWNNFTTILSELVIPGAMKELTSILETWTTLLDALGKGSFFKEIGSIVSEGGSALIENTKNAGIWDSLKGVVTAGASGFTGLDGGNTSNSSSNQSNSSTFASFNNTFNINNPKGGNGLSANDLVNQLYKQFNGISN